MAKTAIEAPRGTVFYFAPEQLTLVRDTSHPLYDPRVEDPPDERMVANIAMHGVLEPIIARKNGDLIEVVIGRGRTKAAIEANRRFAAEGKQPINVPVVLRRGADPDPDLFGIMVAENEVRRDDSMIVKGEKARKLLNFGYTVQQVAVTFGATRQAVESWLAADGLPADVKGAVEAGDISATAALQLAGGAKEDLSRIVREARERGARPTAREMRKKRPAAQQEPVATGGGAANTDNVYILDKLDRLTAFGTKTLRQMTEKMMSIEETDDYSKGFKAGLLWALGKGGD